MSPNLTRRVMLKGLGSSVALPLLSSLSSSAFAAAPMSKAGKPVRLIWLSYGFGPSAHWYPTEAGPDYAHEGLIANNTYTNPRCRLAPRATISADRPTAVRYRLR